MFAGKGGGVRQVYWLRREDIAFFEEGVQLVQERRRAADTVEVHSKGGEGDHGRIGAFMVRTKGPKGGGRRSFVGGAVRVLRDQYTEGEERSFGGLQERGRVEGVDEREIDILPQEWAGEGEGDVEIAKGRSSGGTDTGGVPLHSGRIRGAPRLAEMGAPPWVIQREGRWASQAFVGYVRSNKDV